MQSIQGAALLYIASRGQSCALSCLPATLITTILKTHRPQTICHAVTNISQRWSRVFVLGLAFVKLN